jgi:catalase-peroxidase
MTTTWKSVSEADTFEEGHNRTTGELKGTGTRADLIFGSIQSFVLLLKCMDVLIHQKICNDFVKAWDK